jgi:hypothetical protein
LPSLGILCLAAWCSRFHAPSSGRRTLAGTPSRPDDAFGEPTNVAEVNLDDFEFPEWISEDGCRLYFTSRRPGGSGNWDMWIASRE